MTSKELKSKFLEFFKQRGHAFIPAASLIPEYDPSVLFTTAGMHPLVPYLLGERHPQGKRLVNNQPCLRTVDIEEVGDDWHLTFFEMLGNWSLGDYFREEAIGMAWDFLTESRWLGLNPDRLFVSCFAGDKDAPRDSQSAEIWKKKGIPEERIYFFGKKENWWGPAGETGPCGPDTEIYFDTGKKPCSSRCNLTCSCGKYAEIWNLVFMEYNKKIKKTKSFKNNQTAGIGIKEYEFLPLKQKNVDTGMGLERTVAVLSGKDNVYEIETLRPLMQIIRENFGKALDSKEKLRAARIIVDHMRAATFVLSEGISPSNLDQGYVLRRLIRRSQRFARLLNVSTKANLLPRLAEKVIDIYGQDYNILAKNKSKVIQEIVKEQERFEKTLDRGLREFEKVLKKSEKSKTISGRQAFHLYDTYGFPLEMTEELAKEKEFKVERADFKKEFKKHQEISRAGAKRRFKGGLADSTFQTARLHTATHLLHQALRQILGKHVRQMGSNITAERLRFDFTHPEKLTEKQLKEVEDLVNQKIKEKLPVKVKEMSYEEAIKKGALAFFKDKYPKRVKVYAIGDFSLEICGGPHAKNTQELGHFKIIKEKSSGAGIRRIKAVIED